MRESLIFIVVMFILLLIGKLGIEGMGNAVLNVLVALVVSGICMFFYTGVTSSGSNEGDEAALIGVGLLLAILLSWVFIEIELISTIL